MKLKKCANSHYYNESENERCPYCSSPETVEPIMDLLLKLDEIASLPHATGSAAPPIIEQSPDPVLKKTEPDPVADFPVTKPLPNLTIPEQAAPPQSILLSNDMKTVAMWNAPAGAEPVVGWLVCVKGYYFGQSFTLKTGNNSVGRSMDMDVPLAQENTVSRYRHCIITFEPDNQEFFIQPGESESLTYLNGNLIMSFTKINSRDMVQLGNCEFVFYPLCSDKFSWNKII